MDIQLPGMDGLATTALLKWHRATSSIPSIALIAIATKEGHEKTRVAGYDAYNVKPLCYQDLYSAIDNLLANSEPQGVSKENSIHQTP